MKNNPAIWDPKHPYAIIETPSSAQYNDMNHSFRSLMGLPG